jgi:hypothetical protein
MSAFDAIASDDSDGFVIASIPLSYDDSVNNRSSGPGLSGPAIPSQRPDLEAIFYLHKQITDIASRDGHGGLSTAGQRALLPLLVDGICSALRDIRTDEATRRYVLELEDEEALQMLEVLQTVSDFIALAMLPTAHATTAVA